MLSAQSLSGIATPLEQEAAAVVLHERQAPDTPAPRGSDRSYGIVFALVFLAIALWPLVGGGEIRLWALAPATIFSVATVIRPALFSPLYHAWYHLGLLLGRITTPLVMAGLFLLAVTPIAVLMRLFGKDPLALRFDPDADTYWIPRTPPGPPEDSLKNQY